MTFCKKCGRTLKHDGTCVCGNNSCDSGLDLIVSETNNIGGITKKTMIFAVAIIAVVVCIAMMLISKIKKDAVDFSHVKVGDEIVFGKYEQNGKGSDGKENLEWIVLEKERDRVFVVSKYIIDYREFDKDGNTNWEESSVRQWLNEKFISKAFSEKEQKSIDHNNATRADRIGISIYGASTGEDVFLLDMTAHDEYYDIISKGIKGSTKYAQKRCDDSVQYNQWWLTTNHDYYSGYMDGVYYADEEGYMAYDNSSYKKGIRPAMVIYY